MTPQDQIKLKSILLDKFVTIQKNDLYDVARFKSFVFENDIDDLEDKAIEIIEDYQSYIDQLEQLIVEL
jgi:hypothetical protein